MKKSCSISHVCFLFIAAIAWLVPATSSAMPVFARQYNLSCNACHAAYPRLNAFGEHFVDSNFRLPQWKDTTVKTGDDELALPAFAPFAIRTQAYAQTRQAEAIDVVTGETTTADTDFQSPYLIKLLSSAPLSDHISYYFYGIFAEKGANGETVIEDAWFSHDDVFGSGTSLMLGQFQVSDMMFPRETRMTFQDFMAYRLAGITYERGVMFGQSVSDIDIGLGIINGNGINDNFTINTPGYRRPDHMFDNDDGKAVFLRIGTELGPVAVGLFGYSGEQKNATGDAGMDNGNRDTDKNIAGLDFSGMIGNNTYWFVQTLWNQWDGFIDPAIEYNWTAMFLGVDYIPAGKWAYAFLYNYADGEDFDYTDTIYEGIDINTVTFNASYYFMRNVKGVIELNVDLDDKDAQTGTFYTGHLSKEGYFLLGFDAAY